MTMYKRLLLSISTLSILLLTPGCSNNSTVLKDTSYNEKIFTKAPNADFKTVRNQLLPRAVLSIITIHDRVGEAAAIKQLQTCYETQLIRDIGITHDLEGCIAQDYFYVTFANGVYKAMADALKKPQSDIQPVYLTEELMEKRVYDAMKFTGLQEPDISKELWEIKGVALMASNDAKSILNKKFENETVTNVNEPVGFRNIKWGDTFSKNAEEMVYFDRDGHITSYTRKNDKMSMGGANLNKVLYFYTKSKFIGVLVESLGAENKQALINAFREQYGVPIQKNEFLDEFEWKSSNAGITLNCILPDSCTGILIGK